MNIIMCPHCLVGGMRKSLAELIPGGLKIIRSVDEERTVDYTIVHASEFSLICGNCNNVVLYKKPLIINPQVNILMAWGTIMNYYAENRN